MKKKIALFFVVALSMTLCACGMYDMASKTVFDYSKQYESLENDEINAAIGLRCLSNIQVEGCDETVDLGQNQVGSVFTTRKMGDVNEDDKVNYNDAILVLRASIGLVTIDTSAFPYADADGNEKLNYGDAIKILRASVGLEELQPPKIEPPANEQPEIPDMDYVEGEGNVGGDGGLRQ